jgi:hypothetical protein
MSSNSYQRKSSGLLDGAASGRVVTLTQDRTGEADEGMLGRVANQHGGPVTGDARICLQ